MAVFNALVFRLASENLSVYAGPIANNMHIIESAHG
jgi:hypothetical protein